MDRLSSIGYILGVSTTVRVRVKASVVCPIETLASGPARCSADLVPEQRAAVTEPCTLLYCHPALKSIPMHKGTNDIGPDILQRMGEDTPKDNVPHSTGKGLCRTIQNITPLGPTEMLVQGRNLLFSLDFTHILKTKSLVIMITTTTTAFSMLKTLTGNKLKMGSQKDNNRYHNNYDICFMLLMPSY